MREYEKTHPWISFEIDLRKLDWKVWHLFGEAKAKCEAIQVLPQLPEVGQQMRQLYLIKGIQGTTAIEGNTLTEAEIKKVLDGELKLPKSIHYQGQEIQNIVDSFNEIGEYLSSKPDEHWYISVQDLMRFNRKILEGLPVEEEVIPGKIRQYSVGVLRYRAAPWNDCQYLLERLCQWLKEINQSSGDLGRTTVALLRAILAHLYLAWIHPFGDGNGRTARLIELQILLDSKMPSAAAHLLSNHYNKTRMMYYKKLDEVGKNGGDVGPFIEYALQGFVDGLDEQIEYITEQQARMVWENYIYEKYRGKGPTQKRQRNLLLELTKIGKPVKFTDIPSVSARVARMYKDLTQKAIRRDVNSLEKENLLILEYGKYRPNLKILRMYFPG